MTKKEFITALGKGLGRLSYDEQNRWLDFYSEVIDDRMDEGLSEAKAVDAIGPVEQITQQILANAPKKEKKPSLSTWQKALLIAGAPVWLSLLVAAVCTVVSLLVAVWAVVISFYAMAAALVVSGVICVIVSLLFCWKGNVLSGFSGLGCGLFCVGLGILWFIGAHYMAKGTVWISKKLFAAIRSGKEAAA